MEVGPSAVAVDGYVFASQLKQEAEQALQQTNEKSRPIYDERSIVILGTRRLLGLNPRERRFASHSGAPLGPPRPAGAHDAGPRSGECVRGIGSPVVGSQGKCMLKPTMHTPTAHTTRFAAL